MCYLFKNIFESMSASRACEVIFDCSLLWMLRMAKQKTKACAPTYILFYVIAETPLFLLEWLQRRQG